MPRRSRKDVTANQELDELNQYSPIMFQYSVAADATTAVTAFTAPWPFMVTDITVIAQATSASGTLTPLKGSSALCTAITCAADGALARIAAGILVANIARLTFAKGDLFKIQANGAADRGIMIVYGVRV